MKPVPRWIVIATFLAACTATPVPVDGGNVAPTATLRGLPTATASPALDASAPQATDTPQPTFTPLPSPTPLAYIVQKGDTLIGIAVQHSVSIEALEAANPGIDPGNLQIGQTVFVPPATGDNAPNQAVAPTPLPVALAPFNCSPSPVSSLICLGEFVNQLDKPVANLSVKVMLVDSNNAPVASEVAYAPLDLVPPGQAVPLAVVFPSGTQRQALAVPLTADSGAALAGHYATLTISEVTGQPAPGGFTLAATVANPTQNTLQRVVIVGTVYNAAGAVTGFRALQLPDPLKPAESTQVTLNLPGVAAAARWAIIAQGRIP